MNIESSSGASGFDPQGSPPPSGAVDDQQFRCPLCSGAMAPWIVMPIDSRKESPCRHGGALRCAECGFGAITPRPPADEIGGFYEFDVYYTHGRSHMTAVGPPSFLDKLRLHLSWRLDFGTPLSAQRIHDLLGGRPSDICDIGCGDGNLASQLAGLGHRVVGVEVDPRAIQEALRRGVKVHEGLAEDLPAAVTSRRFDLVIMSHVLEHCLDPIKAFGNAGHLPRSSGFLLCEVPNNASACSDHAGPAWECLDIPRHLNFFVPKNLVSLCRRQGFEVKELYYHGFCRHFSDEWIDTEARILRAIVRSGAATTPPPRKVSRGRAWKLLCASALASKERKYDAVGVVAVRP